MDLRQEQVIIETDRYRIEGALTLPREGYRSRLSDHVNQGERQFFAMNDCTITALDAPDRVEQRRFVMVARQHIVLVTPLDELAANGDEPGV